MGLVYCSDNCNFINSFSRSRQKICREKRDCVCGACGPLQSLNLNLYESCANACNAENPKDRPTDKDAFLNTFDAADLYKRYGIIIKGFDPTKTIEYTENQKAQERVSQQERFQKNILYGVLFIFFAFLLYFFLK